MKKHVTLNDLMIFAYNEFDNKNDIKRIKQAVAKDHFLKDELEMILQTKKFIDKVENSNIKLLVFPSSTSVYGVSSAIVSEDDEKFFHEKSD